MLGADRLGGAQNGQHRAEHGGGTGFDEGRSFEDDRNGVRPYSANYIFNKRLEKAGALDQHVYDGWPIVHGYDSVRDGTL